MRNGIYRHYKGGLYIVLGTLTCSTNGPDDGKTMVRYVCTKSGREYAREIGEFNAKVDASFRFEYVGQR